MEKKKTAIQEKNKCRALQYSAFSGEFLSIIAPYIAMGIENREEWFMTQDGWRVGLGGSLALALMGIAVLLITKKKENKELTGGYITLIIGWFAVLFVVFLLQSIMEQIVTIMFFGGIGICGAFGLDLVSKHYKEKADIYVELLGDTKKDNIKKQIQRDIERGAIKF